MAKRKKKDSGSLADMKFIRTSNGGVLRYSDHAAKVLFAGIPYEVIGLQEAAEYFASIGIENDVTRAAGVKPAERDEYVSAPSEPNPVLPVQMIQVEGTDGTDGGIAE